MKTPSDYCTGYDSPLGMNRRSFLQRFGGGLGGVALASILHADSGVGLHHIPKAKRIIYLFQSGAPSQIDLFDHKPRLIKETGQELPIPSVRDNGSRECPGTSPSLPSLVPPSLLPKMGKAGTG